MMFMMPMPPTIRLTPATQASRLRKAEVVDSWVLMMSCWVVIVKESEARLTLWRLASRILICRITLSMDAFGSTCTKTIRIVSPLILENGVMANFCSISEMGMYARVS